MKAATAGSAPEPDQRIRRKKPYRAPRLKEYGSIGAITRASGIKSRVADGMKGKFNKT